MSATHSVKVATLKKDPSCRAMRVEVCGFMDDPLVCHISSRLRRYRARYNAILRIVITLFASPVPENVLFSEDHPLVAAPVCAVSANDDIPVVRRFHDDAGGADPLIQFENFMKYFFLPHAITHNFLRADLQAPFSTGDISSLLIRHYINEASRSCSFLVADLSSGAAALIDPHTNISAYEADLVCFSLDVRLIICTHCFVDVVSGVPELREAFPSAEVVSGFPLREAGATKETTLSCLVSFNCVSVPSFSPESIIVELKLRGMLVALFTGSAVSTDSLSRADLYTSFPFPTAGSVTGPEDVIQRITSTSQRIAFKRAFQTLQLHFRDRYISGLPQLHRDRVVLFPSHGGYNHVTYQLDLQWSCFLGDFVRAQHCRKVLGALSSFEDYMTYIAALPPLPSPELFHSVRITNVKSLTVQWCDEVASASPKPPIPPLVVDVREASEYHRLHLRGSLLVPMSFPGEEFGAKRAELWLQCLLLPHQSVIVLCGNRQHKEEVNRRFKAMSSNPVEVYLLDELISSCPPHTANTQAPLLYGEGHLFSAVNVAHRISTNSTEFSSREQLEWVQYCEPLYRLTGVEKLAAVEPDREGSVVVDVRTPFEFKNGSHQTSVHFSLSDLCQLVASDNAAAHYSTTSPSPYFARTLLNTLVEKAEIGKCRASSTRVKEIVLYCAAGYRSLIAASILRRAFETAYDVDDSLLNSVGVYDVPGGALQLMTQRPDLWQVKDRSIICIS